MKQTRFNQASPYLRNRCCQVPSELHLSKNLKCNRYTGQDEFSSRLLLFENYNFISTHSFCLSRFVGVCILSDFEFSDFVNFVLNLLRIVIDLIVLFKVVILLSFPFKGWVKINAVNLFIL